MACMKGEGSGLKYWHVWHMTAEGGRLVPFDCENHLLLRFRMCSINGARVQIVGCRPSRGRGRYHCSGDGPTPLTSRKEYHTTCTCF